MSKEILLNATSKIFEGNKQERGPRADAVSLPACHLLLVYIQASEMSKEQLKQQHWQHQQDYCTCRNHIISFINSDGDVDGHLTGPNYEPLQLTLHCPKYGDQYELTKPTSQPQHRVIQCPQLCFPCIWHQHKRRLNQRQQCLFFKLCTYLSKTKQVSFIVRFLQTNNNT